jgi:hypothetical protein
MVEQESRIYRQVQRRESGDQLNYQLLDMMMYQDIPINHGPWKVLTWLRTREGNYIQQYASINGTRYKLCGSRGNHIEKILPDQSNLPLAKYQTTPLRSTRCCSAGRISKRLYQNIINSTSIRKFVTEEGNDFYKKLEVKRLDNQLVSISPRPLSKKIELINKNRLRSQSNDDDGAFLGDYSNFEMPKVLLEIQTRVRTSLDPQAKKYLKEILPHSDIDEGWSEFALSALKNDDERKTIFNFEIPYQEGKKNILVREIMRSKEDNEQLRIPPYQDSEDDFEDPMDWTFAKDVDKSDAIESEVADIIKDLTNSVFINLNDDLFTQEDTVDRREVSAVSPIKTKQAISELSTLKRPNKQQDRVLHELRRLNANFFKSQQCVDDVS